MTNFIGIFFTPQRFLVLLAYYLSEVFMESMDSFWS